MLGPGFVITKCKCKFTCHSMAPGKMPADQPSTWLHLHQSIIRGPAPCADCSWCAGPAKGEGCACPLIGQTRRKGLISLKEAERLCEGGGGIKKIALPSAVKRGIIGASSRRLFCHLASSIPRKSHLVIRRRGGKRSNQAPIQPPFSDSPCWLAGLAPLQASMLGVRSSRPSFVCI